MSLPESRFLSKVGLLNLKCRFVVLLRGTTKPNGVARRKERNSQRILDAQLLGVDGLELDYGRGQNPCQDRHRQ